MNKLPLFAMGVATGGLAGARNRAQEGGWEDRRR